jgi:uncharacterized protein YndB with AHSA1/START domain
MTDGGKSSFVYVTYIRTTPDRLWAALTSREFAQQYWRGARPEADWKLSIFGITSERAALDGTV